MTVDIREILLDDIEVANENIRKSDPTVGLSELKASILRHGLLEPIVVYPVGKNEYRVLLGQRRFLACKELRSELGDKILAKVIPQPDNYADGMAMSAIENLQRRDLTAKDRSAAITLLLKQLGTVKKVADSIGLSESTISKWLKFDELVPAEIKVLAGKGITRDQALGIVAANYPDTEKAIKYAKLIVDKKPTPYAIDRIIKRARKNKSVAPERIVDESTPEDDATISFHLIDEFAFGIRKAAKEISADDSIHEAAKIIVEERLVEDEYVPME